MDHYAEPPRELEQPQPMRNDLGGETFTVIRRTYYTTPAGQRKVATEDVERGQPIGAR